MRRADRLFQIVLHLRQRRFATARQLADWLEVSERTIYRDIDELSRCGVPIDGEAGVGYRLRRGYDLPPLMFDREELAALRLGARMVKTWADAELARAAGYALTKIETVLPAALQGQDSALYVPDMHPYPVERIGPLRQAIDQCHKLDLGYIRADGVPSARRVWPLGLFFWGATWTLAAWCELRADFRQFRLDRLTAITLTPDVYTPQPGRTLADFFRRCADEGSP